MCYRASEDESATPSGICFKSGELNATCVEEAVHLGGCIGKVMINTKISVIKRVLNLGQETKLPIEWIPLLEDPCLYLKGPNCACPCCDPFPAAEKVGIVGAGMAGLTMAWILQHIGHEVIIRTAIYGTILFIC